MRLPTICHQVHLTREDYLVISTQGVLMSLSIHVCVLVIHVYVLYKDCSYWNMVIVFLTKFYYILNFQLRYVVAGVSFPFGSQGGFCDSDSFRILTEVSLLFFLGEYNIVPGTHLLCIEIV